MEEADSYSAYPRILKEIKVGPPWLTKYERARIIGARALQLSYGAPPLISPKQVGSRDPVVIARFEVDRGLLPASIYRYTSSGVRQAIPLRKLVEAEKVVLK